MLRAGPGGSGSARGSSPVRKAETPKADSGDSGDRPVSPLSSVTASGRRLRAGDDSGWFQAPAKLERAGPKVMSFDSLGRPALLARAHANMQLQLLQHWNPLEWPHKSSRTTYTRVYTFENNVYFCVAV